jgi:hypothetical protein
MSVDDEWDQFVSGGVMVEQKKQVFLKEDVPEPSPLHVSTRTIIAFLNTHVENYLQLFWDIPITPYISPEAGVVQKQTKFNSETPEQRDAILHKLSQVKEHVKQKIILQIDKPNGRVKFKDNRKISIGISSKDLLEPKETRAFFNTLVMIVRLRIDGEFKEFHTKLFNTGKVEIPGIKHPDTFLQIMDFLVGFLQPFFSIPLQYNKDEIESVLVNSNFDCNYYIQLEKMHEILVHKYQIQAIYDPCNYPGIQCSFYYYAGQINQTGIQHMTESKKYKKESKLHPETIRISFMIFRTGSVLIVGKIKNDEIKEDIYRYLVQMFKEEYPEICAPATFDGSQVKKKKKGKKRKLFYRWTDKDSPDLVACPAAT